MAHLNTFLSLARGHVEIEMYDQERLLIVPGTSQYFLIPSVYRRIEISTYGPEHFLIVLGTSQYFISLDMLS